jgi:hypothetical protein
MPTAKPKASGTKKKVAAASVATVAMEVVSENISVQEPIIAPQPPQEVATVPVAVTVAAAKPTPAPKKKTSSSKKPVKVVAVVTPNGIEGSFTPEPRRPLIAHLQIKTNEVVFHDQPLRYDPNPPTFIEPQPYDASIDDIFAGGQEEIFEQAVVAAAPTLVKKEEVIPMEIEEVTKPAQVTPATTISKEEKPIPCFTKANLMVQYKGASEVKELPDKTDIACFWCVHPFSWKPCIIPEREVNGVYNVYGNFCCPECAVAYLLSEPIDPHIRWERMALLQRIYDQSGKGRVFPAPARESLMLFGGPLSIESFRATIQEGKVRVDLHMPPMVSILGSIDTKPIDFFDISVKGVGGQLPSLPQRSVEEGLRLKRSKPLKDRESTLDTVMNIRIGGR